MPRKKTADALLVQGLLSTSISGLPIILATAVKEYINAEDIVNHASQAFVIETGVGARVADDGTNFIFQNGALAGATEIPSKNAIAGDFSGATALSTKARIVSAGSVISIFWLVAGSVAEPEIVGLTFDVGIRIVANGAGDPVIEFYYVSLSSVLTLLAATASYPIAETALIKIERTGGLFVFSGTTTTLGTVSANISTSLVRNGSSNMFVNVTSQRNLLNAMEYELNEITGYPTS